MTGKLTKDEVYRWTQVGVLVSLALVFGYVETLLAIPIPGVRLGLANVVVIIALETLPLSQAAGIAVLKVLVSGLLFGSPLTVAYASLGTLLSFCVMALLVRSRQVGTVAVSVCGALFHTLGQLIVAEWLLGTAVVWAWSPLLAASSVAAGIATGLVAQATLSAFLGKQEEGEGPLTSSDIDAVVQGVLQPQLTAGGWQVAGRLAVLMALLVALFQTRSLAVMGGLTALSLVLAWAVRVPASFLRRGLPLALLALATAALQLVTTTGGEVVAVVGPVSVTTAGLAAAAITGMRLVCPLLLCACLVHSTNHSELRALARALMSPLSRRWKTARGIELALAVAFSFLPVEQALLERLRAQEGLRLSLLTTLLKSSLAASTHLADQLLSTTH